MLSTAASTSKNPLDVEQYWKHVGLNSSLEFSDTYRTQIIELAYHNGLDSISGDWTQVKCLSDMVQPFWAVMKTLANGWELTHTLRLVYHHQLSKKQEKKQRMSQAGNIYEVLLKASRDRTKSTVTDGIQANNLHDAFSSHNKEIIDLTAPSPPESHQSHRDEGLLSTSPKGKRKGDELEGQFKLHALFASDC